MRPEPRAIQSVVSCAFLLAAAAGGCNALIGLEVGELDSSQSGADATSASSSGGPGTGGSGAGGEGTGGAGGGDGGGSGGVGGGGGSGGDGGGGGGDGGGSGGGGPLCSDAEGTLVEPSASWGETLGFDVGDLAASDGALTAVITEVLDSGAFRFSVAKWTSGGENDSRYGLSANDVWGLHLSAGGGATYVAGEAAGATSLPGGLLDACRVGPPLVATSYTTSFVAALDASGRCGWAWSVDAQHNTTARAMAASSEAVVFAVDVSDAGRSFGPCELKSVPAESALLAALYPADGACKWQHRLGPRAAVAVKALPVNPKANGNLVTVVGDYESIGGAVTFGGQTPFASEQRDVFVARYTAIDGALVDLTTLNLKGDQQVAQHGAALLPGGDVVIAGSYRGVARLRRRLPGVARRGGHGELLRRARLAEGRRVEPRVRRRQGEPGRGRRGGGRRRRDLRHGGVHGRDPAGERREPHDLPEAGWVSDAARRAGQPDLRGQGRGSRHRRPPRRRGGRGAGRARLRRRRRDGRAPPRRARRAARERGR